MLPDFNIHIQPGGADDFTVDVTYKGKNFHLSSEQAKEITQLYLRAIHQQKLVQRVDIKIGKEGSTEEEKLLIERVGQFVVNLFTDADHIINEKIKLQIHANKQREIKSPLELGKVELLREKRLSFKKWLEGRLKISDLMATKLTKEQFKSLSPQEKRLFLDMLREKHVIKRLEQFNTHLTQVMRKTILNGEKNGATPKEIESYLKAWKTSRDSWTVEMYRAGEFTKENLNIYLGKLNLVEARLARDEAVLDRALTNAFTLNELIQQAGGNPELDPISEPLTGLQLRKLSKEEQEIYFRLKEITTQLVELRYHLESASPSDDKGKLAKKFGVELLKKYAYEIRTKPTTQLSHIKGDLETLKRAVPLVKIVDFDQNLLNEGKEVVKEIFEKHKKQFEVPRIKALMNSINGLDADFVNIVSDEHQESSLKLQKTLLIELSLAMKEKLLEGKGHEKDVGLLNDLIEGSHLKTTQLIQHFLSSGSDTFRDNFLYTHRMIMSTHSLFQFLNDAYTTAKSPAERGRVLKFANNWLKNPQVHAYQFHDYRVKENILRLAKRTEKEDVGAAESLRAGLQQKPPRRLDQLAPSTKSGKFALLGNVLLEIARGGDKKKEGVQVEGIAGSLRTFGMYDNLHIGCDEFARGTRYGENFNLFTYEERREKLVDYLLSRTEGAISTSSVRFQQQRKNRLVDFWITVLKKCVDSGDQYGADVVKDLLGHLKMSKNQKGATIRALGRMPSPIFPNANIVLAQIFQDAKLPRKNEDGEWNIAKILKVGPEIRQFEELKEKAQLPGVIYLGENNIPLNELISATKMT